eukprot:Em0916g2a
MRNSVSPSQKSRSLLRSMLKKYMMLTKKNQELEHKLSVENTAKNELIKKNDQLLVEVQKLNASLKAVEEKDHQSHSELKTNQKHLEELTKRNHELEHKLSVEDAAKNELIKKNDLLSAEVHGLSASLKAVEQKDHQSQLHLEANQKHLKRYVFVPKDAAKNDLIKKNEQLLAEVERLKAADEKQRQSLSEVKESTQKAC